MSIFSGLFRSRDKPQNRTAGSGYSFYLGGSTAGKVVTERSAMQMTAVYSCVRILAEAIAGLPLNLYRYVDKGSKEKALDHPLYLLLHDSKLTAEQKKEKLIREAIEREKEKLRAQDKDKQAESEVVESEPGKDNEA